MERYNVKKWMKRAGCLVLIAAVLLTGMFMLLPAPFAWLMLQSLNPVRIVAAWWPTTWQEEVLLHDGRRIVVKRSQTYGGRHEIGQSPPIRTQTITFTMPDTNKSVTWKSEYSKDIGRSNFKLLALHILNGTSYIVASPNLCLAYNKWGRPNPPYVFFRFDGKEWQRIQLSEFPSEFKDINLVISTKTEAKEFAKSGVVTAATIKELNSDLSQPEYKTILREGLENAGSNCGEMIYDGNGGWIGIGWFRDKPTYEACLKYCERQGIDRQHCPCETLFKGKK
jgi:hypothetical protein